MNLLDILFPKRCVGCGRIGTYFCEKCRGRIRYIAANEAICPMCGHSAIDGATHPGCRTRYGLDGLTSFFRYDGPIRKAVQSVKYRLITDLVTEFVSLVPQSSVVDTSAADYFLPMPLHASRLKSRGFNQAEVLGTAFAARLHIPVALDILRRVRATAPQVAMKTREDRLNNMKHVFQAARTIQNDHILLFDDVFTTGATMRAAANALKRAGAKYIWAVTMAR